MKTVVVGCLQNDELDLFTIEVYGETCRNENNMKPTSFGLGWKQQLMFVCLFLYSGKDISMTFN